MMRKLQAKGLAGRETVLFTILLASGSTWLITQPVRPDGKDGPAAPLARSASPPSVQELLDKYTQALDATDSFIESFTTVRRFSYSAPGYVPQPMEDGEMFERGLNRWDGRRLYSRTYEWGDLNPETRDLPEKSPHYNIRVVTDRHSYANDKMINDPDSKGAVLRWDGNPKAQPDSGPHSGILGFMGASERLDTILRRSNSISVRQATENINGSNCCVIDAHTEAGQYVIWLDPEHSYHPVRITRKAVEGEKNYGNVLEGGSRTDYLDNVRFEKIDGVWVPMEADQGCHATGKFDSFLKEDSHLTRTSITLNPDHDKLGSFDDPLENPAQDPELENGASVLIVTGDNNVRGMWRDGKVIDILPVSITRKSVLPAGRPTTPSIVGRPMPDLAGLSNELSEVQTNGKPLLVCLVDIEQRPSRQCLSDLAKKAESLSARDVTPVILQVSKVDLKQYQDWLKANQIDTPIHVAQSDFGSKQAAWGVRALPWLILTDKGHVVKAEGFAANELGAVLAK